jgi:hypothetical protein
MDLVAHRFGVAAHFACSAPKTRAPRDRRGPLTRPPSTAQNPETRGILTPGINHAPGATGIQIVAAGTYEVTFSVSGVEPSQMGLFLNGSVVPGTVYGSGAGTQQDTGQAIFAVAAGDVLTLRNHSSSAAVTLQTLAGGTQTSVNASVVIEKLG